MSMIKKIWGKRQRLLKTTQAEVDLLYLEKNTGCSIHTHKEKINRFILLSGAVTIRTNLGDEALQYNMPFDVEPELVHQFVVVEDSVMIELAFVKEGTIDENDITRIKQGGKIIQDKFYTMNELTAKDWLTLNGKKSNE